jgi:hypothetical protein
MNHLTENQLNEYLDHLLDEQTRQGVEFHLAQCADCRNQVEALKQVFADLDTIPEIPLTRDLTSTILARLPQDEPIRVWTRAFAAQWGVVVGTLIWLGTQLIPLTRIPRVAFLTFQAIDVQSLLVRLFTIRFPIPEFQLTSIKYQLPPIHFQLPALAPSIVLKMNFQPSTAPMVALTISALLLWVVGNVILLGSKQEAQE